MQSISKHPEIGYTSKVIDSLQIVGSENPSFDAILASHTGPTIGTHSGTFHCDEVLACSMLLYTNHYKAPLIVRSRDSKVLDKLDLIADVGGEYNADTLRFDHHQKTFTEVWDAKDSKYVGIKLSSAGLIYRHYGAEVIKNAMKEVWNVDLDECTLAKVYKKMYNKLILEVDAQDNGVDIAETMKYRISTHMGARIGRMNLDWDAPDSADVHAQFRKAMKMAEEEFMYNLKQIQGQLSAYSIVAECFASRKEVDPSGQIMVLNRFCPWKSLLTEIEEANNEHGIIKFVLFQDYGAGWRIATMALKEGSFDFRMGINKAWRGLRDDDLSKAAGITDGTFVHMTGFIGGAKSYESCLKMALESIKAHNEEVAAAAQK